MPSSTVNMSKTGQKKSKVYSSKVSNSKPMSSISPKSKKSRAALTKSLHNLKSKLGKVASSSKTNPSSVQSSIASRGQQQSHKQPTQTKKTRNNSHQKSGMPKSDKSYAATPPPPIITQQPLASNSQKKKLNRAELLAALRNKLRDVDEKSGVEHSTKHGRGVTKDNSKVNKKNKKDIKMSATRNHRHQLVDNDDHNNRDSLSMSKIESYLQEYSLRFVDLIICCMVVDNYIYGILILFASLTEIVFGWVYLWECQVQPLLPYLLITSGVFNIIEVHIRALANQRLMDYFLVTVFRLAALYSLVAMMVVLSTIEPGLTVGSLPHYKTYNSYDDLPVLYCSRILYDFAYYFSVSATVLVVLLSLYSIGCIVYMTWSNNLSETDKARNDFPSIPSHRLGSSPKPFSLMGVKKMETKTAVSPLLSHKSVAVTLKQKKLTEKATVSGKSNVAKVSAIASSRKPSKK